MKSTDEQVEVSYEDSPGPSSSLSTSTEGDQMAIHQVLYLLERFGISDQFYHELTMTNPTLPRSYKVKRARESISSQIELKRLPQPYHGCYRSLKECIASAILAEVH